MQTGFTFLYLKKKYLECTDVQIMRCVMIWDDKCTDNEKNKTKIMLLSFNFLKAVNWSMILLYNI